MEELVTDTDFSESSDTGSTSSSSSNESFSETTELAKICKQTLRLPRELCENRAIFNEYFSLATWRKLSENQQAFLKYKFLPQFPENNEMEQERTIQMLFKNQIFRFGASPLIDFQKGIEEGSYRPDVIKLQNKIASGRRREQRYQECERLSHLAKSLLVSREKLLRTAYNSPPGSAPKIERVIRSVPKMNNSAAAIRARKRYHETMKSLVDSVGGLSDFSDEEKLSDMKCSEGIKGEPSTTSQTQTPAQNELRIFATTSYQNEPNSLALTLLGSSVMLNNENFKQVLRAHKKRKLEEPDHPELDTSDIRLRDIHTRTHIAESTYRKNPGPGRPFGRKSTPKVKTELIEMVATPVTPPMIAAPTQTPETLLLSKSLQSQALVPIATNETPVKSISGKPSNLSLLLPKLEKRDESDSDLEINVETVTPVKTPQLAPLALVPVNEITKKRASQTEIKVGSAKKMLVNVNGSVVPELVPQKDISKSSAISVRAIAPPPLSTNIPTLQPLSHYHGKIKAATFSDLEGIDMMHLPVDLDESGHIDILSDNKSEASESFGPELMQETHACFLSLIRDIFCSTPNHRMKLEELKAKIFAWLLNPITALNDWYTQSDNWLSLIPSAIQFFAGEFIDQPEDFVPYLEYKTQLNIYQWIGAGRDSDQHLLPLCSYWLSRRHEMGTKPPKKFDLGNRKSVEYDEALLLERPISPPPPRCPTNWTVKPETAAEIEEFRAQERLRFENPHRAFTYRMHGYESVVGPVKGIYTQILSLTKARGHNMLTTERPNFVTILTLVRDATARLPNGEGTRADICELLKSSQYLQQQAQESVLTTIVSGALDRMHTEHDPCVRYDAKRKIWIYLHRNRTENEFEKLHQQFQGVGKHKKPSNRKVKTKLTKSNSSPIEMSAPWPAVVVLPTPKMMPALSTIQQQDNINNSIHMQTSTNVNFPPPLKITSHKSSLLVKHQPELVPIKPHTPHIALKAVEKLEPIDIEASLDAHSVPMKLQKPLRTPTPNTTQPIPATLIIDSKRVSPSSKKQHSMANSATSIANTTTVKVSTPTGIQTVHVATPTSLPSPSNQQALQQTQKSIGPQIIQTSSNSVTQPILFNQHQTIQGNQLILGSKKMGKPIIINHNPTPSLVSSANQGQGFIIPINVNNSDQLKQALPTMSSAMVQTSNVGSKLLRNNQPPALTSTLSAAKPAMLQQSGGKNFVRLTSTTSQTGKSLLNPQLIATNIVHQQHQQKQQMPPMPMHQKITTNTPQGTITTIRPPQQVHKSTGVSLANSSTSTTTTIKSNQPLSSAQQKQLIQSIIAQQQQNKQQRPTGLNISQNTVLIPGNPVISPMQTQTIQAKPIIISSGIQHSPQVQKIINVSSSGLNTISVQPSSTSTGGNIASPPAGTSLINPQIIQIHQTSPHGGSKLLTTTNLTPQQQQSILQSIKQQHMKQQQSHTQNQQPQQSLIIKQQPVFHQIQKQSNVPTSNTITVSVANHSPKIVAPLLTTNVPNLMSPPPAISLSSGNVIQRHTQNVLKHQPTAVMQQQSLAKPQQSTSGQQHTITRIIKPGTQIIHPQVITSMAGLRAPTGSPVMAKVLTNPSGQIISLESLLQKQQMTPGTTLRITNPKSGQPTNLIQIAGSPGSQITQYAVVSQGRNIISVGHPQRLITTQASNSNNTIVTSIPGPVVKLNDQAKQHQQQATTTTITSLPHTNQQQLHQQQQSTQQIHQPKILTASQIQAITGQPLVNAKVLGKTGSAGIRMMNTSNINIAHIRGKPVIITKPTQQQRNSGVQPMQQSGTQNAGTTTGNVQILQGPVSNSNLVIGGQTIKLQRNVVSPGNFQVINQPTSSQAHVMLRNQILKVQATNPKTLTTSPSGSIITNSLGNVQSVSSGGSSNTMTTIASTNTGTVLANRNQTMNAPKTVFLGSTGQCVRVQSPATHTVQVPQLSSGITHASQTTAATPQPIVIGTPIKGTTAMKNAATGSQQRVVLAVQGGGQILLPPGFQGGAINLKSLQGLKVVSLSQQQNKGQSEESPLFAQIMTAQQAQRPPSNGGE